MQDLTDEAENVLWDELMFAPIDGRFTMDLRSIKDDMMFTQRGKSFVTVEGNHLDCGEDTVLKNLLLQSTKRRIMRDSNQWKTTGAKHYRSKLQYFLELLLITMHIGEG